MLVKPSLSPLMARCPDILHVMMMAVMTWPLEAAPGAILSHVSHAETRSQSAIHLPTSLHQLIYTTQLHTGINVLIISNQYQRSKL